ncbi:hypothetical protein BCR36DRAFT_462016 [Piromyces finnis]|uniref:Uncharacterized protein n=1 Tax=Piromyces finnis TaxID=1754191 RepID=A0A1Y1VI57_9FUNG|nr:hypothetical protein BCR36DRAFT_462016 [Piromyces finnis]|eukprot:ORX57085.1 hypothetical protein BCR36DRAFT_462016 [Piromyces finnis]
MERVQDEITFPFEYKEKYCKEDTNNYKYNQKRNTGNNNENDNYSNSNALNNKFCYQWNAKDNCFIENTFVFNNIQEYSLIDINNQLGCISCCKDCMNNEYIDDLLSLKSKSISNISQEYLNYKIITFRKRKNSTDYPVIYHTKNNSLNYCSIIQHTSPCSNTYTCFPITQQKTITSNEIDNDVPDFANIIFILLFIVIVISVIALIWIAIYVIRTYRRHKKANKVSDENSGEDSEEIYDSQDEKEYLSDNYDYVYKPSEVENNKIIKLKIDP